jgi:hypothetical protein
MRALSFFANFLKLLPLAEGFTGPASCPPGLITAVASHPFAASCKLQQRSSSGEHAFPSQHLLLVLEFAPSIEQKISSLVRYLSNGGPTNAENQGAAPCRPALLLEWWRAEECENHKRGTKDGRGESHTLLALFLLV